MPASPLCCCADRLDEHLESGLQAVHLPWVATADHHTSQLQGLGFAFYLSLPPLGDRKALQSKQGGVEDGRAYEVCPIGSPSSGKNHRPEDCVSQFCISLANRQDEQFIKGSGFFGLQFWVCRCGPVTWMPRMRLCTIVDGVRVQSCACDGLDMKEKRDRDSQCPGKAHPNDLKLSNKPCL